MEAYPSIELRIVGMTCSHCRMAVERALAEVHGSQAVDVDLHAGRAVIAGAARPEELVKAVENIGYTAKVLTKAPGGLAV